MLPIHTILHPTDLSNQSRCAFHLACALARDYEAKLIVLHIWSPPPVAVADIIPMPTPAGVDILPQIENALYGLRPTDDSVQVCHVLAEGDPVSGILDAAESRAADLIVMGTHGHKALRRLLMGSVAEQVMREARCPVVTVRTQLPEAEPQAARAVRAAIPEPAQQAV
jgi:nucleotide-binding universal stress UspA family protein